MSWTDERVEGLKKMWAEGKSASQIAKDLGGVTRNAVIGKVHRLGLSNRAGASASAPEKKPARASSSKPATRAKTSQVPRCRGRGRPPQTHRASRAATAAAAFRKRDQPRGARKRAQSRKDCKEDRAPGTDGTNLQVAHRGSRNRRILVLRPGRPAGQAILRGPCRRRVPAHVQPARPKAIVPPRSPFALARLPNGF